MNPENQFTADRDAGSVILRDSGRVMAAPAEFFSMLSYAVASFGGEVPAVLRDIGEMWGTADGERLERDFPDTADLPITRFSGICSDRLDDIGLGRNAIEEVQEAALINFEALPPHARELLAGWFSSLLTRFAGFPLVCEGHLTGDGLQAALKVSADERAESNPE